MIKTDADFEELKAAMKGLKKPEIGIAGLAPKKLEQKVQKILKEMEANPTIEFKLPDTLDQNNLSRPLATNVDELVKKYRLPQSLEVFLKMVGGKNIIQEPSFEGNIFYLYSTADFDFSQTENRFPSEKEAPEIWHPNYVLIGNDSLDPYAIDINDILEKEIDGEKYTDAPVLWAMHDLDNARFDEAFDSFLDLLEKMRDSNKTN